MEQSRIIVESTNYQNLIVRVRETTGISLVDEYLDTAAIRDSKKMNLAKLSTDDATNILRDEFERLLYFAVSKLRKFEGVKVREEYPKGEEVEKENPNEVVLGYSQGFLLMYLIEYYLLKEYPNHLLPYLKDIRIPHAPKYAKELTEIYSKIEQCIK